MERRPEEGDQERQPGRSNPGQGQPEPRRVQEPVREPEDDRTKRQPGQTPKTG